ncbi:SDR family NAD(P)-dependent oxidoreductase [Nocardioides sp. cx-169]|uniref:SDR family NAD(P)-dependent oxidoreductase n=1 Tax=Nocardioides sp. cx-169 TaxID=2899080 RepID=UPI001E4464C8|nr:SDR family NAD(P)-dependent oxidoreductase [Nocardioides sp. cx-169]MCD4533000.1 SDR family NAD(P)-dependent oxidoreductase [Nocardioides sp. cx-169]
MTPDDHDIPSARTRPDGRRVMALDGVAAVTGAGGGIGFAVAVELAARGADVLALDLREEMAGPLEEACASLPGSLTFRVLDVTDPGDFSFPDRLQVLVNNAGIRRAYLPVEETAAQEWRAIFDVNFFGLVDLTARAIPVLRARGAGVICNVTSAAILRPIPFLGPYRASKAAVAGFNETLRLEVAPFGIRVVEVLPGPTQSSIATDSMTKRVADAVNYPPYAPMAKRLFERNKELPDATPAAEVARSIVDSICNEEGPMRHGTSAGSVGALKRWRMSSDEQLAAAALDAFGPTAAPGER